MLDLNALEQALSKIGAIGKGEITFDVDGTPITLRVMTPDEENAVQKYAREAVDEEGKEDPEASTFLERFKRATLSYAIIQVGSNDLRGVAAIPTGEQTSEGTPIRVAKHLAMRKIIDGWSRTATLALFQKYSELSKRVEMEADRAIQFEPDDLNKEVERVEIRLGELKKERDRITNLRQAAGSVSTTKAVVEADQASQNRHRGVVGIAAGGEVPIPENPVVPAAEPEAPVASQEAAPEPPQVRQRVLPPSVPPPMRSAPTPPQAPPAPPAPRVEAAPSSFDGIQNSLGDDDDAIAAETARLMAARAAARQASRESMQQDATSTRRVPPHRAAANTANAVFDTGGSSVEAARVGAPIDGVETYRLPPETLERGRDRTSGGKKPVLPVNPEPKGQPTNPRFKPAPR